MIRKPFVQSSVTPHRELRIAKEKKQQRTKEKRNHSHKQKGDWYNAFHFEFGFSVFS